MAAPEKEPVLGQGFWELIGVSGVLICCAAPCVFAYRLFEWLKLGNWPPITVRDWLADAGISLAITNWAGVQKILDWIQNMEIEWALILVGLFIAFVASKNQTAYEAAANRLAHRRSVDSRKP